MVMRQCKGRGENGVVIETVCNKGKSLCQATGVKSGITLRHPRLSGT